MSKNVEFDLNLPGLNVLMKSGEMCAILNSAAAQLSRQAGGDGVTGVETAHPISFVAIASVHGSNKDNDMEKGMGGVRV